VNGKRKTCICDYSHLVQSSKSSDLIATNPVLAVRDMPLKSGFHTVRFDYRSAMSEAACLPPCEEGFYINDEVTSTHSKPIYEAQVHS
jgi:hypothetical protein